MDKSLIPKGMYCYHSFRGERCPYWSHADGREEQEDGYCSYLGKGDYELNREEGILICTTHKDGKEEKSEIKVGPDNPSFMSLLWDQCKECGENEYTDEDWKEMLDEQSTGLDDTEIIQE